MANFQCYQGIYYIHFGTAILGTLLLTLFVFFFNVIYIQTSFCSTVPFAAPPTKFNVIKLTYKIIITLFFTIVQNGHLGEIISIVMFVMFSVLLAMRIRKPGYNS